MNLFFFQKFNAKLGYFGSAKLHYKFHELDDMEDATRSDMNIIGDLQARDQHTGKLACIHEVIFEWVSHIS